MLINIYRHCLFYKVFETDFVFVLFCLLGLFQTNCDLYANKSSLLNKCKSTRHTHTVISYPYQSKYTTANVSVNTMLLNKDISLH